jgi:hypothetical protein
MLFRYTSGYLIEGLVDGRVPENEVSSHRNHSVSLICCCLLCSRFDLGLPGLIHKEATACFHFIL